MGIIENALDAQGTIQPGTEGWWRVFGACAKDIRVSDMVMVEYADTGVREFMVSELAPTGDISDVIAPRFLATDGNRYRVGALQKVVVLRRGTRHILADSI